MERGERLRMTITPNTPLWRCINAERPVTLLWTKQTPDGPKRAGQDSF